MRRWPLVLALAFVAFVAWWVFHPAAVGDVSARVPASPEGGASAGLPWDLVASLPGSGVSESPPAAGPGTVSPLASVAPPVFKLTPQGRLQVDDQVRLDIERVAALHSRDEALARLDDASRALGEGARREVRVLYEQLVRYEQALATALASEPEQPTLADARRQLQTVKVLRAQHFGERADELFGAEEALQQRLLDDAERLMRSGELRLDEAIGQAQARLAQDGAGAP